MRTDIEGIWTARSVGSLSALSKGSRSTMAGRMRARSLVRRCRAITAVIPSGSTLTALSRRAFGTSVRKSAGLRRIRIRSNSPVNGAVIPSNGLNPKLKVSNATTVRPSARDGPTESASNSNVPTVARRSRKSGRLQSVQRLITAGMNAVSNINVGRPTRSTEGISASVWPFAETSPVSGGAPSVGGYSNWIRSRSARYVEPSRLQTGGRSTSTTPSRSWLAGFMSQNWSCSSATRVIGRLRPSRPKDLSTLSPTWLIGTVKQLMKFNKTDRTLNRNPPAEVV